MGVLLSLQNMERAKLVALGESSHDDTLELGMDFLRAASATSTLAARYVAMLRRIRTRPTDAATTPAVGHQLGASCQGTVVDSINASLFPASQEGDSWLPRSPGDHFGILGDPALSVVDFNDLHFGTGLPRDLLSTDWSTFGLLH